MDFKTQKIRRRSSRPPKPKQPKIKKERKPWISKKDLKWIMLSIAVVVLIPLSFKIIANFAGTTPKEIISKTIVKSVGSKVIKDEDGYTNFLALGTGNEEHEGTGLTDTILVASINQKTDNVIMISLPRDLYVKHELVNGRKINTVYQSAKLNYDDETAYQTITEVAEAITGLDIHYYAKVDFDGLESIVNALDGVEVDVEETIYDPYYPTENYGYQTFSLGKGLQTLDGETALKYVRSRKTTSDFDRSRRQQKLLFAIKDKALKLNVLTSKSKISELIDAINENFETNMEFREMVTMAEVAIDLNKSNFISLVIHDDPNNKGGFLYTPPRSQFGDMFVLLPADGNYEQIHTFVQIHKDYPDAMINPPSIKIFNGTRSTGLAGATKQILKRFGFPVSHIDNAENRGQLTSSLYYPEGTDQNFLTALTQIIPAELIEQETPEYTEAVFDPDTMENITPEQATTQITIELGEDFIEIYNQLEVYSALVPVIQQAIQENRDAQRAAECEALELEEGEECPLDNKEETEENTLEDEEAPAETETEEELTE